ncbi:DUF924 family protein [Paraburkholderia rhynchosiae]|uniref:DUF924 domain-containing protein n=1 Tax=Paraburkholderia rhynchosiae TaxID=487049 RepID=A0A2N7WFE2_9BURK|nr:DUF924 family protein [Paraburkholderia rhynchosiae]PMS28093.1 DUF924 domain-containing protein [Paraburkholderia rhynchosiae]CAB3720786.1 hypothetical protein LMG27174_04944 [Paraburkholderia rhynchosiae]
MADEAGAAVGSTSGSTSSTTPADYAALDPQARAVLDCWFGAPDSPDFGRPRKLWFAADESFDAMLRERFGTLIEAARESRLDTWATTPLGALALVIVLDQFSRNCHRDTAHAFAADQKALDIAQQMVASGADRRLPGVHHRAFAYLPFEHDETLASQHESLRLYEALAAEPGGESYYPFAVRHAKIIERFGRFPHRNAVLGRDSTAEEIAFLREPGSSFKSRTKRRAAKP